MAIVAFFFSVALHAFGLVVIRLQTMAVAAYPCINMGFGLYLRNIIMTNGTLA